MTRNHLITLASKCRLDKLNLALAIAYSAFISGISSRSFPPPRHRRSYPALPALLKIHVEAPMIRKPVELAKVSLCDVSIGMVTLASSKSIRKARFKKRNDEICSTHN
jgi:hypothetical protein